MNPSTAQAKVIVDELVRSGVREIVASPGSRNAPLSMAVYEAARAGRLTLHVRIDERSAGFLALGLAKGLRVLPDRNATAAVLCTSGTAVANLHPAVLEAHHSGTPLLLLTADRPDELHGTGANQTVAQRGLFSSAAPCLDFPLAERRAGQNAVWRGLVCRAVAQALAGGPVQVNLPFREPLVPDGTATDWPEQLHGRPDGQPWTRVMPARPSAEPGHRLGHLRPRTLMVVGDDETTRITFAAESAAKAGWPVIAEPTARAAVLGAGATLLSGGSLLLNSVSPSALPRPDSVVVVGRPTLSRGVGRLLRQVPVVHVIGDQPGWTDPGHVASHVTRHLAPADLDCPADPAWLAEWQRIDQLATTAAGAELGAQPWPTGLRVASEVVHALPAGALLFLGSSNPIRLVDLVCRPRADLLVAANRGVAGIDGSVSTAIGLTLAAVDGRIGHGYALLGDLTFLHDTNGLLIGPEPRPNLTIVVFNDDGGGIFTLLEQGAPEHAASFERMFGTPHGTDLVALCAAHHVSHVLVESIDELRAALRPAPGLRVVEVRAPRHAMRADHERLRTAVRRAVSGVAE